MYPVTLSDHLFAGNRDGTLAGVPIEQVTVLECNYCKQGVVVIEEVWTGNQKGLGAGTISWHGIHWWPTPGATAPSDPSIPSAVANSFAEGTRCLAASAPNAAAAMFRNALAALAHDRHPDGKGVLKDRIKELVKIGGLPSTLATWATHVRLTGNAGVHPEIFGAVTDEEAEDLARLTMTLIEQVYVIPAQIAARQAARRS